MQADTADLGRSVQVFKMHGESYHRIGNILEDGSNSSSSNEPQSTSNANFLALYFFDLELDSETELDKRVRGSNKRNKRKSHLDNEQGRRVMEKLQNMMKKYNIF